ncbi:hypothetical protein MRX96_003920 [Rhipicephalus microplus]
MSRLDNHDNRTQTCSGSHRRANGARRRDDRRVVDRCGVLLLATAAHPAGRQPDAPSSFHAYRRNPRDGGSGLIPVSAHRKVDAVALSSNECARPISIGSSVRSRATWPARSAEDDGGSRTSLFRTHNDDEQCTPRSSV